MKKVAIMTDSLAAIPQEVAQQNDIRIIPLHVIIDGKDYLDTEVDMGKLYARLKEKKKLPTTSAISVGEFLAAYHELSKNTEAILFVSLTSKFTKGYEAAIEAREIARKELPQTVIEVIDSQTVTCAELFIVLEAAKAAAQGKSLNEVIQIVNSMIPRVNQFSVRDTLLYLDKGGRVFEAKSWAEAESAASFRSIVEVDASTGGVTKPVARARTKTQVISKMVDIAKERVGDKKLHAAIGHTNVPGQAEQLREMILSQFQCEEIYATELMGVAAVMNGEGLVEFGFYGSD
jgi:DegV family protein with EDD domain